MRFGSLSLVGEHTPPKLSRMILLAAVYFLVLSPFGDCPSELDICPLDSSRWSIELESDRNCSIALLHNCSDVINVSIINESRQCTWDINGEQQSARFICRDETYVIVNVTDIGTAIFISINCRSGNVLLLRVNITHIGELQY